ncbi:hypothetical protein [Micromonospora carbonacea]|uniref:Uncharacterized protein n=1 Tax=Micromonospora carbonacea TaxID=47853 RepID=A0A1C5AAQ2_9ACTN|nr:hypothetical protein [Micromonospora carbonacea]SCF42312.1 hypothetical protein GA0070563_11264 [Micromonospora carbonacea]
MANLETARAAAHAAAYQPLADTNIDNKLAHKAATAVVDALLDARTGRGLAYLRGMRSTVYQMRVLNAMNTTTSSDFTLFFGRMPMYRAIEAAAAELVAAFGRR